MKYSRGYTTAIVRGRWYPKPRYDDYAIYYKHKPVRYQVWKQVLRTGDVCTYWENIEVGEVDTYNEALALIRMHKVVGA